MNAAKQKIQDFPGYGSDEVQFMKTIVKKLQPTHIFEWGTNLGASASIWHELTKETLIATVEHPDQGTQDHPGARLGLYCAHLERVHMLSGDGVTTAIGCFQVTKPKRALFFLDGDHRYDSVLRELNLLADAAPKAWLLIHDTKHPLERTGQAVETFLRSRGRGYHAYRLDSQAGMMLLKPARTKK